MPPGARPVSFTMGRSCPDVGPPIAFLPLHLMIFPPSFTLKMTFNGSIQTGAIFAALPLTLPTRSLHSLAPFPAGLTDGDAAAQVPKATQGIHGRAGATQPSLTPAPVYHRQT